MKVLIVGGVAGGASAAARLRRLDETAEIILFERGEYISFANCGLPYYIGNVITNRESLLVVTKEMMRDRFRLDIRTNCEVLSIDRGNKKVKVHDAVTNNEYHESYDKLILSPGAAPLRPPLPGVNGSRIYTLRNIPDTDAIRKVVDSGTVRSATVVGGGFIGIEMAENLKHRGVDVTLVEMLPQVMAPLDIEMAAIVHQHLKLKGVHLALGDGVAGFEEKGQRVTTTLASGQKVESDIVILAIGVKPEIKLAVEAGIETGRGIVVNEAMLTSDPDIYAVGDAVEIREFQSGSQTLVPLAWPANKQGRIAADNIAGLRSVYQGTQGTSIVKAFDLTVATTGLNEKQLVKAGIPYLKTYTHSGHHAGYYPGAIPMSIKILFSPDDGKLLGAQIVGIEGVDKRIDVLATAIRARMTVFDIESLELAYAPPYSSAKDPAIMAAFVAGNVLSGRVRIIHWDQIAALDGKHDWLLDVRAEDEFELGSIEGATNIPVNALRERLGEIPADKRIVVFCQVGLRGYIACRILMAAGLDCVNLSGGYLTWHTATLKHDNTEVFEFSTIQTSDHILASGGVSPTSEADRRVDACGLQCPGPVLKLFENVRSMQNGETVEIAATDPGFAIDIKAWCERTGNQLVSLSSEGGRFTARVRKGQMPTAAPQACTRGPNDKTIVLFSGDFDKAMAAFIIGTTAASMGGKVTIFFTFWGLNLLRQHKKVRVKKTLIERMFGRMMPRGSRRFKLSKMHMAGMGTGMIKRIMRKKHVPSLEELIQAARESGIRLVACQMTMDLMGIKPEELIEGVEKGGAASYIGAADTANMNLFI